MKKRILSFILSLCIIFSLLPTTATASTVTTGVTGGELAYQDTGASIAITGYSGSPTAVDIPATINGKSVTSINSYAFSGCASLTSVIIPSSVTAIGERAFYNCTGLASVSLSTSTSFAQNAFEGCIRLETLPYSPPVYRICKIQPKQGFRIGFYLFLASVLQDRQKYFSQTR